MSFSLSLSGCFFVFSGMLHASFLESGFGRHVIQVFAAEEKHVQAFTSLHSLFSSSAFVLRFSFRFSFYLFSFIICFSHPIVSHIFGTFISFSPESFIIFVTRLSFPRELDELATFGNLIITCFALFTCMGFGPKCTVGIDIS